MRASSQKGLFPMFEKLSDNLNQLMSDRRISADELGRRTNLPASTIKKIRNRYNPNPTLTTLLPLAKFFEISLSQLVGDEPLPLGKSQDLLRKGHFNYLPLLSWEEAIDWPNVSRQSFPLIKTESHLSQNAYALSVLEEDWENLAKDTTLIIDPLLAPHHRDFVIVHKKDQPLPSLKQALFDEEVLYLRSIIAGYHTTKKTSEHRLLGVVVEYKKHLRIMQTKEFSEASNEK